MLDSLQNTSGVIDPNIAFVALHPGIVQPHHGYVPVQQAIHQPGIELRAHNGHSAHFVLNHSPDGCLRIDLLVVRHSKYEFQMFSVASSFKTFNQLREKRILDIGDDQSKRIAVAANQQTCRCVLVII